MMPNALPIMIMVLVLAIPALVLYVRKHGWRGDK